MIGSVIVSIFRVNAKWEIVSESAIALADRQNREDIFRGVMDGPIYKQSRRVKEKPLKDFSGRCLLVDGTQ